MVDDCTYCEKFGAKIFKSILRLTFFKQSVLLSSGYFPSETKYTVRLKSILISEGSDMKHHVHPDKYAQETDACKVSRIRKTIF